MSIYPEYFYYNMMEKYTYVFGSVFNSIQIKHGDKFITVPIRQAAKEKYVARKEEDPDLNKKPQLNLPMIAYELIDFNYDNTRRVNPTAQICIENESHMVDSTFSPIPYDFIFELRIRVRNKIDGYQIVEQILPFFAPELTLNVNKIPKEGFDSDIVIILDSVNEDDTFMGSYDDTRVIEWTLTFTLKGYLFLPVSTNNILIKKIDLNFFTSEDSNTPSEIVEIQPGLTANGEPTTNSAASIDYRLIDESDDWDYCVDTTTE